MGKNLATAGLFAALSIGTAVSASAQPVSAQSVIVTGHKDPSRWFRAESQHVIVYSDTSQADVTQLLGNLEKLDHVLRIYTKNYRVPTGTERKLTLYYHERMGGFNDLVADQPPEAVGLYTSCESGVQGFGVHLEPLAALDEAGLAKHNLNSSLSYLFEAYARHFLYRYTDIRAPVSYIDGFAQYFSSVRFSDKYMLLGRAPSSVARYLYFLDQGHRYQLSYQDVFEPPASKEVGATGKTDVHVEFLARSWLLTHYMMSSAANRDKLETYLDRVHHDVPASKAFTEAFGMAASKLGDTLWRYRTKGVEAVQVDLPSLPAATVSFTGFPDSSTAFLLADAALKSCPGRGAGEALLRRLSVQARALPNNELARLSLSRAQIGWGHAGDALPYLTDATRRDPANFEAVYLQGLAHLRLAEAQKDGAGSAALEAAKRSLAQARNLQPASAEAAFAFYRAAVREAERPDQSTLEGAISAWKYAHEVNTFARSAALAFAYLGRGAEADRALTLLAHDGRDPAMAAWATSWQGRLGAGVSRSDLLAEMRREPGSDTAFKEWTVASDKLMNTVENNASVEDARGYVNTLEMSAPAADKGLGFSLPTKK